MCFVRTRAMARPRKRRNTQGGQTSNTVTQNEIGEGDSSNSHTERVIEEGELSSPSAEREMEGAETSNAKTNRKMVVGHETSHAFPPPKLIGVTINRRLLECSICFVPLKTPLYQCPSGHVVCDPCWMKVEYKCPSCGDSVGARNKALEDVLGGIRFPCPNAYLGCHISDSYKLMQLHPDTCEFGPPLCPNSGCVPKDSLGETSNSLTQRKTGEGKSSNPLPPKNENEEREELLATISSVFLECAICFHPLCSPLYQCFNGHVACPSCRSRKQHKCHICDFPVVTRNIALERIVESIHLPCSYASSGCDKSFIYSKWKVHIESCEFSPTSCPILGCNHNASSGEWRGHFLKDHWNTDPHYNNFGCCYTYGQYCHIQFEEEDLYYTLVGPHKDLFLLVKELSPSVGYVLSLYYVDLPDRGQNVFPYELEVVSCVNCITSSLTFKSKAVSIKEWKSGAVRGPSLLLPLGYDPRNTDILVLINKEMDEELDTI